MHALFDTIYVNTQNKSGLKLSNYFIYVLLTLIGNVLMLLEQIKTAETLALGMHGVVF